MRKTLILFSLILATAVAFSSQAVDYREIEVDVTMNPSHYRELLDRFVAADTTLTNDEMSTVYFGFAFTPSYEPRDTFPEIHAAYERKDFDEVVKLIGPALELNPVSLDLLIMGYSAYQQGYGENPGANALQLSIRCDQIATAILESGRGTMAYSPFYVICDADRKRILSNVIGIGKTIGTDRVGNNVEAIKFTFPGNIREHILYFDNTLEERFLSSHPK
jgi:hypothetical protein